MQGGVWLISTRSNYIGIERFANNYNMDSIPKYLCSPGRTVVGN